MKGPCQIGKKVNFSRMSYNARIMLPLFPVHFPTSKILRAADYGMKKQKMALQIKQ
jgi:hypothetical protein